MSTSVLCRKKMHRRDRILFIIVSYTTTKRLKINWLDYSLEVYVKKNVKLIQKLY